MEHPQWKKAITYLAKKDKKLEKVIKLHPHLKFICKENAFQTLIRSVVGQQISVKAADGIWQRITENTKKIHFSEFTSLDEEQKKKFGLSQQKANYIKNIALHFKKNKITTEDYWKNKNFENISEELLEIKGIGVWTVQMFGIFYCLEPDIFPTKDLGLIKAIKNIYGKNKELDIAAIEKIALKWKPWRSIATFLLWRTVDNNLVTY